MSTTLANKLCEVCGSEAIHMVTDMRADDYVIDPEGGAVPTWKAEGEPHFFCGTHKRKPVEYGMAALKQKHAKDQECCGGTCSVGAK
ncbi:MAG: hypothetical protein IID43_01740 [Planctomycetes bacterium]|nr:hypothetical protein [Planctomycetota bacterium]